MKKPARNYAFIDSQNLNLGIQKLGWKKEKIHFMNNLRGLLEYKRKAPREDGTSRSAFP